MTATAPRHRAVDALPLALFALASLPAIFLGIQVPTGVAVDAIDFHIPQINVFIRHPMQLLHYPAFAATTPGYHMLMAALARLLGIAAVDNHVLVLRLASWAFGVALFVVAPLLARRAAGAGRAAAPLLLLPLAASWYVVQAGVYYGNELAALLAFALLLLALERPAALSWSAAPAAVAMVLLRHMYAPVVLAPIAQALLSRRGLRGLAAPSLLAAVAAPLAVLLVYAIAWGGMVPPGIPAGLNKSGIFVQGWVQALAYLGLLAIFFLPMAFEDARAAAGRRGARIGAAVVLLLATLLWLAAPSTFSPPDGRWGSILWSLAQHGPAPGGRALLLLPLVWAGALFGAYLVEFGLRRRAFPPELAAFALYAAGLALTQASYQRYIEPVALLVVAVAIARVPPGDSHRRARYAPPLLLALLFEAGSLWKLYG